MYYDAAYAPFGEAYAESGTTDRNFTGMDQDIVGGLYDFPAREYNALEGRWPSPDPAGLASVNPADPQTWNRYAYVRNSPLSLIDPTGMQEGDDGCETTNQCTVYVYDTDSCYGPCLDLYLFDLGGEGGGLVNAGGLWSVLSGGNPCALAPGACGGSNPCQYALQNPCGSAPNKPPSSRAVCAAQEADKYSIAGALGTTNDSGFFANVFNGFAGNFFSGVVLAAHPGLGNKWRAASAIGNLATGGTKAAVSGVVGSFAGEAAGNIAGGFVFFGKLGYDGASFTAAYLSSTCRSGG